MDKDLMLIIVNAGIAVAGFVMALLIHRLTRTIDGLAAEDAILHKRISEHREDVLRNYVRNEQLEPVKKDIIGRVDRMELSFKEALMAHEHREMAIYQMRSPNHGQPL